MKLITLNNRRRQHTGSRTARLPSAPWAVLVTLVLSILVHSAAIARTSDFSQAIDIQADRSEFNEKAGTQTLSGNVVISQGTMSIKAQSIEVTLKDNKLSLIEGTGSPISFEQENDQGELVRGQCDNIVYDAKNGQLTLIGNATLSEPKQNLSSDRIVFDSIKQTVVATGGQTGRVSITIQPPDSN